MAEVMNLMAKTPDTLPPGVGADDPVLLFDGVCNLCNGAVRFVIGHDPEARLRLASIQSPPGQAILRWLGMPTDRFDTMVLVEHGRAYTKSNAALRIARHFGAPWSWLAAFVMLPTGFRDWFYDNVAQNRYRWFGRTETCMVPTPELRKRFL
jgi:predicted DCC family thiol-disulfide oxidoreductase YuxK